MTKADQGRPAYIVVPLALLIGLTLGLAAWRAR